MQHAHVHVFIQQHLSKILGSDQCRFMFYLDFYITQHANKQGSANYYNINEEHARDGIGTCMGMAGMSPILHEPLIECILQHG